MNFKYYWDRINDRVVQMKMQSQYSDIFADSTYDLLFIISAGRSGSTLLRKQMMENIPVHIPPESSEFIIKLSREYISYKSWREAVNGSLRIFNEMNLNEYWQLDLNKIKKSLNEVDKVKRHLKYLIYFYYKYHGDQTHNKHLLFGDKSPILSMQLEWIKIIYPNAKYIHLVRDPFDVTHSRMVNFNESLEEASSRWVWAEKEYRKNCETLDFFDLTYQQLTETPKKSMMSLSEFLNVKENNPLEKRTISLGDDVLEHHAYLYDQIEFKVKNKYDVFNIKQIELLNQKFKEYINC